MNRLSLFLVLVAGMCAAAWPRAATAPRTYVKTITHPDKAVEEALIFLLKLPAEDRCFYRFVHFLATSDEDLADDVGDFKVYLAMVGTGPTAPAPVAIDAAGRVFAIDLREGNWSADAWHAVVRLDKTCTEPNIGHALAEALREGIAVPLDKTTFHCEGLVPGPWLVRQLQETDQQEQPEDIVYYNLLYSRERFGDDVHTGKGRGAEPQPPPEVPWGGGVWTGDDADKGKHFPPGAFRYTRKEDLAAYEAAHAAWARGREQPHASAGAARNGFIDRNFPRDLKDFQVKWGVKAVDDVAIKEKFFARNGTIVAGFFNDPKNGSYVSFNDRIIEFQTAASGPAGFGLAMRTFDFKVTAGKRNVANDPLGAARNEIAEDAGEDIASTPAGFPVWLLTAAAKDGSKRLESGDPHVVRDATNGGLLIVQTLHKCVGCHYPSDVILSPSNEKIRAALDKDPTLLKARTKEQVQAIEAFFFDGDVDGWAWKLKAWREPFRRSLVKATRTPREPEGWTGARFAAVSNARRDAYDRPVTLGQAAAELGYPRTAVVAGASLLGSFDAQNLVLDGEPGVPRAAWDDDLFPKLAGLLSFAREVEIGDPAFQAVFPQLVRDSYEKFNPKPRAGK